MGRIFANILETVGNTPVVRVDKLAPASVPPAEMTDKEIGIANSTPSFQIEPAEES